MTWGLDEVTLASWTRDADYAGTVTNGRDARSTRILVIASGMVVIMI